MLSFLLFSAIGVGMGSLVASVSFARGASRMFALRIEATPERIAAASMPKRSAMPTPLHARTSRPWRDQECQTDCATAFG